jgi:hypothetical protein
VLEEGGHRAVVAAVCDRTQPDQWSDLDWGELVEYGPVELLAATLDDVRHVIVDLEAATNAR